MAIEHLGFQISQQPVNRYLRMSTTGTQNIGIILCFDEVGCDDNNKLFTFCDQGKNAQLCGIFQQVSPRSHIQSLH